MDEETVERIEENDKALGLYKEQLDALKENLEVVIAFAGPDIVNMARQKAEAGHVMSSWANPGDMDSDKGFREKCRRFAERYKRLSQG
jgi:hypothetical protein